MDSASDDELARITALAQEQPPFGQMMGIVIVEAGLDRVVAEISVGPRMANRFGWMHGGAIMGVADAVAGTASVLNLAAGQTTTTIESKTNFFRSVRTDTKVRAACEPLHKGRRTMVWQTSILREDGKLAALVTQTQMILEQA